MPNGLWFHFVAQELRMIRFVGRAYFKKLLAPVSRVAVIPIISLLSLLSYFDHGSHEVMCFGYMVRAVKKS